jgi:uncharacterized protein YgiM (DUF1202 family)
MNAKYWMLMVVLGLWGCASGSAEHVAVPIEPIKVYFYVGTQDAHLKSSPDYGSADAGTLILNEQVEKVKRGEAGWFLVSTQDGRQGWINEKYLRINPVSEFFVRRWGVRLRNEPQEHGTIISKLRTNDQVKLIERTPQGWAKITVAKTQQIGWLKMADLSVEPVVIRPVRRKPAAAAQEKAGKAGEAADLEPIEAPPSLSLTPPPAEAAPPPVKKPSPAPKARPEMFEPF